MDKKVYCRNCKYCVNEGTIWLATLRCSKITKDTPTHIKNGDCEKLNAKNDCKFFEEVKGLAFFLRMF